MNIHRIFKLTTLVQSRPSYPELVQFFFGETPPSDHNFLEKMDLGCITELIQSPGTGRRASLTEALRENIRMDASIAFLIRLPFDCSIYENIYRHLPEAEYVIDTKWIYSNVENPEEFLDRLLEFISQKDIAFRVLSPEANEVDFFNKYAVIVSSGKNSYITNKEIKSRRAHVMYTASKDSYTFGLWCRYFDLALTFGPYSHERMLLHANSRIVGNPRFDGWFREPAETGYASSIKSRLDSSKKTILYLPTYGDLSSLPAITAEMAELTRNYNLVVRPHHFFLYFKHAREEIEDFKNKIGAQALQKILWADDFVDSLELFALADVVVSDNSGAIFDAVLADKPLVIFDLLSEEYFQKTMWDIRQYAKDVWIIPGTYPDSIEQRIKREPALMPGRIIKESDSLPAAIQKTLSGEADEYKQGRKLLRDMLFSHADGSSGKRAAEALRGLAKEPPRRWNLLNYAAEEANFGSKAYFREENKALRRVASGYINLSLLSEANKPGEIEFSVILPVYNGNARIGPAVASLLTQTEVLDKNYEIIIVDDGSSQKSDAIVKDFMQKNPEKNVVYAYYPKNRGPAFARNIGIKLARGKFICFTDDDCTLPADWLSNFRKDFLEHPEVAGVGGGYVPVAEEGQKVSIFNRFVFWEPIPYSLAPVKSTYFGNNFAGNTANVCYKKSALVEAGGFNYYFMFASSEDWELRIRIQKLRYALLYKPQMIEHRKGWFALHDFIRFYFIRGWTGFFLFTIHPEYVQFNRTPFTCYKQWLGSTERMLRFRRLPEAVKFSYVFILLNMVRYISLGLGKFGIALWDRDPSL